MSSRIIPVLALLMLFSAPAPSQTSAFMPANDVVFRITLAHSTYRIGESIDISYTIRNVSNASILVPRGAQDVKCLGPIHLSAWFEDPSGNHNPTGVAGSCLGSDYIALADRIEKGTVLLKPGAMVHGHFTLETRPLAKLLAPGRCRLEAMLSGWRQNDFTIQQERELARAHRRILTGAASASTAVTLTK